MSTDSKSEAQSSSKTDCAKEADNNSSEKKPLTFKDWKSLKESQNKTEESPNTSNNKSRINIKNAINFNRRNERNGFAGNNNVDTLNKVSNFVGLFGFLGRNKLGNDVGRDNSFNNCMPLMPPPMFNYGNFSNNNGNFSNNNGNFSNNNGNFNNFNGNGFNFNGNRDNFNGNCNNLNGNRDNFNGNCNNFNGNRDNFNGNCNNFNGNSNNFNNNFNNGWGNNNFSNGPNNFQNGFNNFPDSFFNSDGMYRQKDMMQQPLENPFKDDYKANSLLNKLHNKEFRKNPNNLSGDKQKGNNKRQGNNKQGGENRNSSQDKPNRNVPKLCTEPKIFIANPKGNYDGKAFIPKPTLPGDNPELTIEERKQQWKDYRIAMKPFKNRDFYNAKRVVQRLGKKDPAELDEKEILRLANAREVMSNHKERLSTKYSEKYVKSDESPEDMGELYVLQKNNAKSWNNSPRPFPEKTYQNYGNFGENTNNFGSGRKIVGGYSGFIAGGMLEGNNVGKTF